MAALGSSRRLVCVLLQDLLLAQPDVVIFAQAAICTHKNRRQPPIDNLPASPPAPLLPPGKDGRAGKLTPCTTGRLCRTSLAAVRH